MTRPVLAAFDPKSQDPAPARFALAAARFAGAPAAVVSVCALPVAAGYPIPAEEDLGPDAQEALEALRHELDVAGAVADFRMVRGRSAPSELHRLAEDEDAMLLVVGSTERGAAGRVFPGSTAERLMHGAPCPIAVVPRGWSGARLRTIGVAFVDTAEGYAALRGARELARRAGATLRVITAAKPGAGAHTETQTYHPGQRGRSFDEVEGEHRVRAEAAARAAVAELDGDVPVEVDALLGDAADVLTGISPHLDLLICGSRGYGPLRAVLLGGVTRRVTAAAHCPVVVLPRGVEFIETEGGHAVEEAASSR
jgi:nucleotide-binding universal stress UspA family protein